MRIRLIQITNERSAEMVRRLAAKEIPSLGETTDRGLMQVPRDGRSVARVAQLRTGNLPVPVQTAARNVRLVELLRPAPGVPSEASLSAVLVRGMSDLENLDFNHTLENQIPDEM